MHKTLINRTRILYCICVRRFKQTHFLLKKNTMNKALFLIYIKANFKVC